jgi:hypothetical protein
MIQHFVCFKFKDGTSSEAAQQHLDMFAGLKAKIPQIVDYAGGPVVPGDKKQFDTAHNVIFKSLDDLAIYIDHADHQHFIEANKAVWENVLVVDSEIK